MARQTSAFPLTVAAPRPGEHPQPIVTRVTYRQLMMRGLDAPAAANLTAYMAGLAIGAQPWSLPEINRMLFLRDLAQRGRWAASGLDHLDAPAAV